jgi:PilZ domain
MSSGNLRRHARRSFPATIRVGWQDQSGQDKSALTRSFDISESGRRFELSEPVALRSDVTLRGEKIGLQARAVVRSCVHSRLKYMVGVEFGCGYRWTPPSEEIRHALEAAEMLTV